jgi:hypothetical protein
MSGKKQKFVPSPSLGWTLHLIASRQGFMSLKRYFKENCSHDSSLAKTQTWLLGVVYER